ncbi:MAG: cation:proton antiporter [Paludibacteraceae bacterium]|nr:cation:proton antiporter [Paludibacteraceae bacterium]
MTSSLAILALVMGVIFITPVVCRRLHVPSIVGFILMGVVLGPHGLGWIAESETIKVLGNMGMLYIMFQAGVEIDMNDFRQYRHNALVFGLYSFIIPFALGFLSSWLLGFGWSTCALLGAMYGSHTLMTYPIVSRYGIQKNAAVNIVVGGTMVSITLSLLVLAVLKSQILTASATVSPLAWYGMMAGKILLFAVVTVVVFPWVAQWYFKRWKEPVSSFMLVMVMLVVSAWLADWAGLEGILGAFVCGVSLNRLIPNLSPLMSSITFFGNSTFVPLFLLGVGMMIDVSLLWKGWTTVVIAGVMILTKLAGKGLSAWLGQWSFHLSGEERRLMFGLTHATAAGTLAIVTIGYQVGLFNAEILNAAVLMILVLCTSASFITEHAAKHIALQEEALLESDRTEDEWLMMSVSTGDAGAHEQLKELSRLSSLHESKFVLCSDWQDAESMVERTSTSIAIYHEHQPLNTVSRLLVAVPRYAEKEHDFISCFGQVRRLSSQIGARVVFFANEETQRALQALCRRPGKFLRASYREMEDWEDVLMIAKETEADDMVVMISARHATASYNPLFRQIPDMLERFFAEHSWLIIYPQQQMGAAVPDVFLTDQPPTSRSWDLITRTKAWLLKQLRKRQVG